jgi:hypothetical protein
MNVGHREFGFPRIPLPSRSVREPLAEEPAMVPMARERRRCLTDATEKAIVECEN